MTRRRSLLGRSKGCVFFSVGEVHGDSLRYPPPSGNLRGVHRGERGFYCQRIAEIMYTITRDRCGCVLSRMLFVAAECSLDKHSL